MRARIDALEAAIVPARGTSEADVARRFGAGRPTLNTKGGGVAPPDAPHRAYDLPGADVLFVRFQPDRTVGWAHVLDPFAAKGRVVGRPVPEAEALAEARTRLAQLERLASALGVPLPR